MMKNLKMPPELKGLKLADRLQSSKNLDVDIITGNDNYGHYWKHNKNCKRRLDCYGKQIRDKNDDIIKF